MLHNCPKGKNFHWWCFLCLLVLFLFPVVLVVRLWLAVLRLPLFRVVGVVRPLALLGVLWLLLVLLHFPLLFPHPLQLVGVRVVARPVLSVVVGVCNMLYQYNQSEMYTDKDLKELRKYQDKNMSCKGNDSRAELINDKCDYLIMELLKLQAIISEPQLTAEQQKSYNQRKQICNTIWKQLKRFNCGYDYYIIRRNCNKIYNEWRNNND